MLVTMRDRTEKAIADHLTADQFLATSPTREFDPGFGGARYGQRFARLLYVGLTRRAPAH
jgi:hypothetical protein